MKVVFLRQAHKFIKKANPPLKAKIKEEVLKIAENTQIGEQLKGKLKPLRSHHFIHVKTQYRISYKVEDNVIIVVIGTRENYYRDLIKHV